MAAEQLIDQHIKAFNDHNAQAWASHYTPNAVVHDPQYPEPLRGREAIQKDVEDFFSAFPDMHFTVTNTLVSGDRGAIEGIGAGTHRGPLVGPGGTIPATNRQAKIAFVAMIQLDSSGLIAEERRYYDLAGMMQQLGLMPEAPAA
jgi:steroid delta-isomerase-like uncharacterized protein